MTHGRRTSSRVLLALAALCLAGALTAPMSPAGDDEMAARALAHRYVGVRKCRTCHGKKLLGNQAEAWQRGLHSRAFDTLANPQSTTLARELGLALPPQQAPECLRCHITAYGLPIKSFAYELLETDGVQCESCHGPGRDYRKKKIMSDPKVAAAKGLWDLTQGTTVCLSCHNSQSPTWDPQRFTLKDGPDGATAGFDFDQAVARIAHPIPETTKGRYLEIEERLKKLGLEVE